MRLGLLSSLRSTFNVLILSLFTQGARGLLARQRQGMSEQVVLVGERPLAQAVKSFERTDPITLPLLNIDAHYSLILKGLLLVKYASILSKPVLTNLTKLPWVLESSEM